METADRYGRRPWRPEGVLDRLAWLTAQRGSERELRVLGVLVWFAGPPDFIAKPAVDLIVKALGDVDKRTVQRALYGLRERRLITPVAYAQGGGREPTRYRVNYSRAKAVDVLSKFLRGDNMVSSLGVTDSSPGVTDAGRRGDNMVSPKPERTREPETSLSPPAVKTTIGVSTEPDSERESAPPSGEEDAQKAEREIDRALDDVNASKQYREWVARDMEFRTPANVRATARTWTDRPEHTNADDTNTGPPAAPGRGIPATCAASHYGTHSYSRRGNVRWCVTCGESEAVAETAT